MKITCNVVRDLLPLYAEEMVSGDSRELVDEHLNSCEACRNLLEGLRVTEPIPVEIDTDSLKKVKKTIIRRRAVSIMASLFTLITLACFVITYLFSPFQLTMEEALDDFYIREDGAVVINYSPYVTGRALAGMDNNWYIIQYSNRYDIWKGNNRKTIEELYGSDRVIIEEERLRYEGIDILYGRWATPDGSVSSDSDIPWREDDRVVEWESEKNWWYSDPRGLGNDILLHDAGQKMPEKEDRITFSPVYPVLFFGGIAVALILQLFRKAKRPWIRELSARFTIVSSSVALSTLAVSSGHLFTNTAGIIDSYWGTLIGLNGAMLTLSLLFWRQLYLLNKQDKAI